MDELERLREEEGEEKEELSTQLKEASRTVKFLHSSLSRARKKQEHDDVEYICQSMLTEVSINHHSSDKLTMLVRVEVPGVNHLQVYEAQGEYGNPKYPRLPTHTAAEVADLQPVAPQNRGHMVMELMTILAGEQDTPQGRKTLLMRPTSLCLELTSPTDSVD